MKSLLKLACIAALSFSQFSCAEPEVITPNDVYYANPEIRPTSFAEVSAQTALPSNEKTDPLANQSL